MAQLKIMASDFTLLSTYSCTRVHYAGFNSEGVGIVEIENYSMGTTTPTKVSKAVVFDYKLPANAVVKSAKVYAKISSPLIGVKTSTINGVKAGYNTTASVDVEVAEGSTSVSVPFVFQCEAAYHYHSRTEADGYTDSWAYPPDDGSPVVKQLFRTFSKGHTDRLSYSDVYLLIDYEGGDDTGGEDTGSDTTPDTEENETTTESGTIVKTVMASGLTLNSAFDCVFQDIYYLTAAGTLLKSETKQWVEDAATDIKYAWFNFDLPPGAIVKSAKVHATFGRGKCPKETLTIAGVPVGYGSSVTVPIGVSDNASSTSVRFTYKCVEQYIDPGDLPHCTTTESVRYEVPEYNNCTIRTFTDRADDVSSVYVSDLYLTLEYTMPAVNWSIVDSEVEANEELTVKLKEVSEGYTYTMQVTFKDGETEEISIPVDTMTANVTLPMDWLYLMTDAATGVGTVTVREYLDGKLMVATAKPFTFVCPDSAKPGFMLAGASPSRTVDGVTYPAPVQNVYVQNKCGVFAHWGGVSAKYGATIVSQHVNVGGYDGEAYNAWGIGLDPERPQTAFIRSGLLTEAGQIPVTLTVVDSRGMSLVSTQYITVADYRPPSAEGLKVWRVNADGVEDKLGAYAKCSFTPSGALIADLINTMTATLTVAGQSETFVVDSDVLNTCWLLPSNHLTLTDDGAYALELTLTDRWESVTFKAVTVPPVTGTTVVIRPARKSKRGLKIGDYDTVLDGDWTMSALSFPEPEPQNNFVTVPGRVKGPLDMSTVLTDGEPTYGSRPLSATLENSNGTRQWRNELIQRMVNQLHGRRWEIIHPDYPDHFIVGRVALKTEYSDMAHCAVSFTATCEPWKYSKLETEITYAASATEKEGVLSNMGGLALIPTATVTDGSVSLICGDKSWTLQPGKYNLPELILHPGNTYITYSGDGIITFAYREAVL